MRSTAKRFMVVMMAMAMVVALPAVALAHHPEITAEPDCVLPNGSWYLDYTATAWATGDDLARTHSAIDIYVNGVLVDTGAFASPGFSFSGTYEVPSGTNSVTVRAVARTGVAWGNGHLPNNPSEERWVGYPGDPTQIQRPTERCEEPPGTGTPGYWHKIDHWDDWGLTEVTVGGVTYSANGAIDLINKPVKGDKTLTMFPALVAAVLNVEIGNDSSCIAATIAAANTWMASHPPESGVKANSSAWDVGGPLASTLDDYNNGRLCAPHRD